MLISLLKKYYQKPFREEIESGFELIFYKLVSMLLSVVYTMYYIRPLLISRRRVYGIKEAIVKSKKSVFVFANGPSLSDIDLGKVKKLMEDGAYDLIAVNSFLSKSSSEIRPTFAVFSDSLHFNAGDKSSQYFEDVDACENNGIRYFVPFQNFDDAAALKIGYNAFCDIYSENTDNILTPPGFYGLTALHALRIANHLGYQRVYLCGFDNSYFKDFDVKDNCEMVIRHRHYYDERSINVDVPCIYRRSSEFFFDSYRHFRYIEKITGGSEKFVNIAKSTYLNSIARNFELDVYKKSESIY